MVKALKLKVTLGDPEMGHIYFYIVHIASVMAHKKTIYLNLQTGYTPLTGSCYNGSPPFIIYLSCPIINDHLDTNRHDVYIVIQVAAAYMVDKCQCGIALQKPSFSDNDPGTASTALITSNVINLPISYIPHSWVF